MKKPATIKKAVIVTRTKNRTLLLERAIKSVDLQTYKDYIHVVVNDGGDKKAVDELARKYPNENRVIIHNKASAGGTRSLNQGINSCDTEYVFILDDDDSWSSDRLRLAVDYLDATCAKGVVSVMDKVVEELEGDEIRVISKDRWRDDIRRISLYEQCLDNHLSNGCFSYRREVYSELGGYDETLEVAEDWDFGLRFLQKYDVDFIETDHALVNYHHRPNQKGDAGNTVFAGVSKHDKALNAIMNRYLREDIREGRFGIGYIINDLKFRQKEYSRQHENALRNTVRIEGHVNYVADDIKQCIRQSSFSAKVYDRLLNRSHGK